MPRSPAWPAVKRALERLQENAGITMYPERGVRHFYGRLLFQLDATEHRRSGTRSLLRKLHWYLESAALVRRSGAFGWHHHHFTRVQPTGNFR